MSGFMSGSADAPSVPFDNPGDYVSGQIVEYPVERQSTDINTKEPATWPNGQPKMMWVVRLQTALRNPQDPQDTGERSVFLRWRSLSAVQDAVRRSGAKDLDLGGILTLTMTHLDPKTGNRQPPKNWSAQYQPPAVPSMMAGGPPQQQYQAPQQYEPQPYQAPQYQPQPYQAPQQYQPQQPPLTPYTAPVSAPPQAADATSRLRQISAQVQGDLRAALPPAAPGPVHPNDPAYVDNPPF